jgi:hypothetical protein
MKLPGAGCRDIVSANAARYDLEMSDEPTNGFLMRPKGMTKPE